MDYGLDVYEIIRRLVRYLIEGICVGLAAYLLPHSKLRPQEILLLGLSASSIFAVLDLYSPTISASSRFGAGAGIGLQLIR